METRSEPWYFYIVYGNEYIMTLLIAPQLPVILSILDWLLHFFKQAVILYIENKKAILPDDTVS